MDHERFSAACDVFGGAVGYEFSILEVSTTFCIIHKDMKLVSLP